MLIMTKSDHDLTKINTDIKVSDPDPGENLGSMSLMCLFSVGMGQNDFK